MRITKDTTQDANLNTEKLGSDRKEVKNLVCVWRGVELFVLFVFFFLCIGNMNNLKCYFFFHRYS